MAEKSQDYGGVKKTRVRHQHNPQPGSPTSPISPREHGFSSAQSPTHNTNTTTDVPLKGKRASTNQYDVPYVVPNYRNSHPQPVRESMASSSKSNSLRIDQQDEVYSIQPRQSLPPPPKPKRLQRALNANQITMITIGTTFGTGFLMASGKALNQGGPLGVLIAYIFVGFICYTVLTSICEMATYMPYRKGFVGFASKFIHPAIGFALGWTYLCKFLFVPASHINTAAIVTKYFMSTVDQNGQPVNIATNIPADVWRAIYIVIVVSANFLNVRRFGQLEFWLSTVKILVLVALILFGMGVDAGGSRLRNGETVSPSFGYWKSPHGPMGHAKLVGNDHSVNMFLGFWASMVRVWFSYMGTEQLGAVVGEAKNPRVSVPKAVKRSYRLVIILYVLGIYIVGLTCPSDHARFQDTSSNANTLSLQGHVSPFKIVANELADKGLGRAINAAIIVFAISGAISNLYTASRVLHGLALDEQAPALLAQVRLGGIPLLAIVVGGSVCTFSFLGHSEENSNAIFDHFVDFTTTAGAISWICILWSHIRFRKGLKAQDYPADTLKYYTSPVYPYGTWFALASAVVFTIFKGVESVALRGPSGFVAAYMLIFWFAFLAAIWWYWKKDPVLSLKRIDLEVEEQEI